MACSVLVVILSLLCLLSGGEYHPGQCMSSSTINETLNSEDIEDESPSIG